MTTAEPDPERLVTMTAGSTRLALWLMPAVAAGGLWSVCFGLWWHDFQSSDVFEYALVARNLATGRGYVSNSLWLNDLPVGAPPYEYPLHRSPLACAFLVPGIAMAGDTPLAILAPSLLLFMALAAWVGRLGASQWGGLAGACAVVLFVMNYNVLVFALSGLPTLLFGTLVTALLVLLAAESLSPQRAALAGVVAGLGYLTRPNMALIAVGALAALVLRRRTGLRGTAIFALAVLVTVSPYLVANYRHTGSLLANSRKYVMLFDTDTFPGSIVHDYAAPPEPLAFYREHPDEFVRKVGRQIAALPRTWWSAFRLAAIVFVVVGVCVSGGDAGEARLREVTALGALGQVASDLMTVSISRFWIPFVPVVCLLAGLGLARTLRRLWSWRIWSSVLVAAAVLAVAVRPWWRVPAILEEEFRPRPDRQIAGALAGLVGHRDELVAAFNSAAVAWYADQRAINLPGDPRQLLIAEGRAGAVSWIVTGGPEYEEWMHAFAAHPELSRRFRPVRIVRSDGRVVARVFGRTE